jgi:hypothetical protein
MRSCVVLLCVLALAGCTKSEYWIPGLTLPSGSTVTQKAETTSLEGMAAHIPFLGTPEKVLTVSFDNSAGWSAVAAHIDGCMTRQGYTDSMGGMAASMPGGAMPAGAAGMLNSVRMYTKGGSKYSVMLMDMGASMAAAGSKMPAGMQVPGMGGFMLSVIKAK